MLNRTHTDWRIETTAPRLIMSIEDLQIMSYVSPRSCPPGHGGWRAGFSPVHHGPFGPEPALEVTYSHRPTGTERPSPQPPRGLSLWLPQMRSSGIRPSRFLPGIASPPSCPWPHLASLVWTAVWCISSGEATVPRLRGDKAREGMERDVSFLFIATSFTQEMLPNCLFITTSPTSGSHSITFISLI